MFRCAGEDEWCVVGVCGDAEWRRLCEVMGRADLADDAALASAAGRDAARARIDEAVGAWTAGLAPDEVMVRLQRAGIAAGTMLRVSELPDFGFFKERRFFEVIDQPQVPEGVVVDNAPMRSGSLAGPALRPAPVVGQHTRQVIAEVLRKSAAEIDALIKAKVLEAV